jgi:hypothetical protein
MERPFLRIHSVSSRSKWGSVRNLQQPVTVVIGWRDSLADLNSLATKRHVGRFAAETLRKPPGNRPDLPAHHPQAQQYDDGPSQMADQSDNLLGSQRHLLPNVCELPEAAAPAQLSRRSAARASSSAWL